MKLFGLRTKFSRPAALALSTILFGLTLWIYGDYSSDRHAENPRDKLMPTAGQMLTSMGKAIFRPNVIKEYDDDGELIPSNEPETLREAYEQGKLWNMLKNGEWQLWEDTMATGYRVFIAMIFILFGIFVGLYMGLFPVFDHLLYRFVLFFDKIPALALLPILFIVFGLGETAKIALIVIGVAPTIILDTYLRVKEIPNEHLTKGMTLRANSQEIVYKIVLPQIMPKVLDTIRLNFKAVILFLIAGEALAAEAGLGYRIFVVRRYMDMATIIPYVLWISLLAFLIDYFLRKWIQKKYVWLHQ
ncbi:MAG: ABC transporter permease subunit [Reichenbachiella sp.]|uniref:ABC transporter permease n=3 Tax=Reichenbachiella sp. TaxID=2184521 RepID=UPI003265C858